MKHCFFFSVVLFGSINVYSQVALQWQKAVGGSKYDQPFDITATSDGGCVAVGMTRSSNGDVQNFRGLVDYFVVKLNSSGQVVWKKNYGGTHHDWAYCIKQTPDNGFVLAGFTMSEDGDVTGLNGEEDGWVIKLDSIGNVEWKKCFGGNKSDVILAIDITDDGGYIFTGYSDSNDGDAIGNFTGSWNLWVGKLASNGNAVWNKYYGGSADEIGRSIKQTVDGSYIVGGETRSTDGDVVGNNGNLDFWLLKVDKAGKLEWQHPFGGIGADGCNEIVEVFDGYVGVGFTGSNDGDVIGFHGYTDSWVLKVNKAGELQWQIPSGGTDNDLGMGIIEASEGVYVVSGEARSHDGDLEGAQGILYAWAYKITKTGQILWSKTYGGSQGETADAICRTTDGDYVTAGIAWSNDGDVTGVHGECDFWIVKLSEQNSAVGSPAVAPLEVFPNPVKDRLQVQFPEGESHMDVTLTDPLGRVIIRSSLLPGESIDLQLAPQGLFVVEAVGESGKRYRGKCSRL